MAGAGGFYYMTFFTRPPIHPIRGSSVGGFDFPIISIVHVSSRKIKSTPESKMNGPKLYRARTQDTVLPEVDFPNSPARAKSRA